MKISTQQIIEATKRAAIYWLNAQVLLGKTEKEVIELYSLPETKETIKASAKILIN